jgi:hypothetical protein
LLYLSARTTQKFGTAIAVSLRQEDAPFSLFAGLLLNRRIRI